jgi:hypothetical protein
MKDKYQKTDPLLILIGIIVLIAIAAALYILL